MLAVFPGIRELDSAVPGPVLALIATIIALHGLVNLEIAGNFASMGIDPDQVFEAQVGTLTA